MGTNEGLLGGAQTTGGFSPIIKFIEPELDEFTEIKGIHQDPHASIYARTPG